MTRNQTILAIIRERGEIQTINTTETLEALIDQIGLFHVLTGLELVCLEKAEHITNWQDNTTAKAWSTMAKRLKKLSMQDTTA